MKPVLNRFVAVSFLVSGTIGNAQVQCPPEALEGISVNVTVTVGFNSTTQRYVYTYVVNNVGTKNVERFYVVVQPPVEVITTPQGWAWSLLGGYEAGAPQDLAWKAIIVDETPGPYRMLHPIRPGESKTFALESPTPPGAVPFSVAGDDKIDNPFLPTIPPGATENERYLAEEAAAETLLELCPQLGGHISQRMVQSVTKGPTQSKLVKIDIKPGVAPPNPVNPYAEGPIPVAVYSTTDPFYNPVASIDVQSVTFGRNYVKATWYNTTRDINGDGTPDLLFLFPNRAAGFRCFDKAEFLYGKEIGGTPIIGYDAIAPSCQ